MLFFGYFIILNLINSDMLGAGTTHTAYTYVEEWRMHDLLNAHIIILTVC
jgi:hypothetical protein